MSAIAGRVLIIPKGAYNANVTYNLLDAVFFNGSTYIAKDTTTGNPPSDTEHWQILAQGAQDAAAAVFFGTCVTAGSSQNKEVSVEVADNFALKRGAIVGVKFTNTNTFVASAANHITLNVNSSGVYSIYFGADADPEGTNPVAFGEAGFTNYYQFDGTYWTYVGRSGVQTAEQTPYDNTTSGLVSDNVNDAIDEVKDILEGNLADTDAVISANGAKNLNSYPYTNTTKTENGITFTDNGDGTVTVNGTATANTFFYCHNHYGGHLLDLEKRKYKGSGCPTGGSVLNGYSIQYYYVDTMGTGVNFNDEGNGVSFDLTNVTDYFHGDKIRFGAVIYIVNGATVNNLTFKPMITLAEQPNSDYAHYVPYAKTNSELTAALDRTNNRILTGTITPGVSGSSFDEFAANFATFIKTQVPINGMFNIVIDWSSVLTFLINGIRPLENQVLFTCFSYASSNYNYCVIVDGSTVYKSQI